MNGSLTARVRWLNWVLVVTLSGALSGCAGSQASPADPTTSLPIVPSPAAPVPVVPVPPIDPSTIPPPKAQLTIKIDDQNSPYGIPGASSILFDASDSTGEALTFVVEFGDGQWVQGPWAYHTVGVPPLSCGGYRYDFTAHVTVTDRFGRSDSADKGFFVSPLTNCYSTTWSGPPFDAAVEIQSQEGNALIGRVRFLAAMSPFHGTVAADNRLVLRLDDGSAELTGFVRFVGPLGIRALDLRVHGGLYDGMTKVFTFYDPY